MSVVSTITEAAATLRSNPDLGLTIKEAVADAIEIYNEAEKAVKYAPSQSAVYKAYEKE